MLSSFRALVVGITMLLLVLSGCAGIPTSGPVGVGDPGTSDEDARSQISASGPEKGADPNKIVRGFIAAAEGTANNFAVAKKFLTQGAAATWNPLESVSIYPRGEYLNDIRGGIAEEGQEYSIDIPIAATVDSEGRYTAAAAGKSTKQMFGLTKVDGQWRISSVPNGIVLSESMFESVFDAYSVYFYDSGYDYLVPDVRWFIKRTAAATDLVQALLDGPVSWLGGAAISAFPEGTKLPLKAVTTLNGKATVTLDDAAQDVSNDQKSLMRQQIEATLRQIPSIQSVEVFAGSSEFGSTPEQEAQSNPQVEGEPVVVADGQLRQVSATQVDPISGVPSLAELKPSRPAASLAGNRYAFLGDGGKKLYEVGTDDPADIRVLAEGKSFVAPSYAPRDWLWTGEADNEGNLIAISGDGKPVTISAPWLADRELKAVQISRDGARIAVLSVGTGGQSSINVTGIRYESAGEPSGLNSPVDISTRFDDVKDISWAGDTELALVGRLTSETDFAPWRLVVGGPMSELGTVPEIQSITASSDGQSMYAGTAAGKLYSRSGGSWQELLDIKGSDPSYPG
ncbi:LpqB family beta-propeller domain-containing protein [Saxibacter everestensis]|uniref:LpqB family beta-propeller domain-containing protein n=1 Tax=Saxibacter everestensis TaxID=2909229 RepID=A0ABY8QP14_9MICO|nr:LpqB family beta-propeller domain-containing protein [Brevibacteriaceae bacterium ZFBP1038]